MNRGSSNRPRRSGPPSNVYRRSDSHTALMRSRANERTEKRRDGQGLADASMPGLDCGIKEECGACAFVNTTYAIGLQQKFHKAITALKNSGTIKNARVVPPVAAPKPLQYRSLFKLAVRAVNTETTTPRQTSTEVPNRFVIGLFKPGTHEVVSMENCPLHTTQLKRLVQDLSYELNKTIISPFEERSQMGQLRYLAARSAHLTGEIILTFVLNSASESAEAANLKNELKKLVEILRRRGHTINSAHVNFNRAAGNAIFGSVTERIAGADRLRERLCDLDFEVGPTSFFQINPWQAINLYRRVEQIAGQVGQKDDQAPVAWDLYCGTGQISLLLARAGYRVLGIEENPAAALDGETNAKKNRLQNKVSFIAARVEDSEDKLPQWSKNPALIVANPSRRGLAETTRAHLSKVLEQNPTSRFVYVSCEVETLARDLKDLTASGFKVRQVEPFDMFPQTDKMEWIVVLTK